MKFFLDVGKTCILLRYVVNEFRTSTVTTIGVDFHFKDLVIDGQKIRLQVDKFILLSLHRMCYYLFQIWDTAGAERFRTITSSYYRGARAILLVYDVTNGNSFRSVKRWVDDIDKVNRTLF